MISPETIAQVRERTDIVAVIRESVPSLKQRGRTFVGLCPFHKEKTPSFHVNPDRGFFHCFGCKESGSAIDFLMKTEGHTFPEAVRDLAERAGIEVAEDFRERTEVDRTKKQRDDLYAVNHLAASWYERQLREHPHRGYAQAELARRGLELPDPRPEEEPFGEIEDTLQAFRIGYAPAGWDGLAAFLRGQGVSPAVAEQVGLLVPRSSGTGYYDRFRHRLMFAVVDPQGRVVAFSGRSLDELTPENAAEARVPPREGSDKPAKYINSPESPIYTKGQMLFGIHQARHDLREHGEAIVVEGNFDVVSLHARGMKNVVAPLGTAFTVDQARLLKRFATRVVLCFDGDAAGKKAISASRGPLREAGLATRVAILPADTDPDDLARSRGIAALRELTGRAKGMLEYLIESALDASFTSADAHGRAARVAEISRLLAEEDDPLVRMMAKAYANELAGRIDLKTVDPLSRRVSEGAFQALEQAVKRALAQAGPAPARRRGESGDPPDRARIAPRPPGSAQRANIVGALVEFPELLGDPEVESALPLLEGPSARTVAALADAFQHGWLDVARLLERVDPSVHGFVSERLAAPQHDTVALAKAALLESAARLKTMVVAEDTSVAAREGDADWEAALERAAEASVRHRESHGIPSSAAKDHANAVAEKKPFAAGPDRKDEY